MLATGRLPKWSKPSFLCKLTHQQPHSPPCIPQPKRFDEQFDSRTQGMPAHPTTPGLSTPGQLKFPYFQCAVIPRCMTEQQTMHSHACLNLEHYLQQIKHLQAIRTLTSLNPKPIGLLAQMGRINTTCFSSSLFEDHVALVWLISHMTQHTTRSPPTHHLGHKHLAHQEHHAVRLIGKEATASASAVPPILAYYDDKYPAMLCREERCSNNVLSQGAWAFIIIYVQHISNMSVSCKNPSGGAD